MGPIPSAIVAGVICLDVIPDLNQVSARQFTELLQPGHMIEIGPAAFSTGGAVANTGLALYKLGIPTTLMAKVGDDLFGQVIRQIAASYDPGLAEGIQVDPAAISSYTLILNPPELDRLFLHCKGVNDTFGPEDVDYQLFSQAGLFHFGYPPAMKRMYQHEGIELAEIFRLAKSTGITTSLDLNFPDPSSPAGRMDWRPVFKSVLPYADLFLPSIEELLFMLHPEIYARIDKGAGEGAFLDRVTPELLEQVSDELIEMGAKVIVIKLGDQGLYLRTAGQPAIEQLGRSRPANPEAWSDRELWAPCFKVKVVGTTGAGDVTIAGFHSALLRNRTPEESVVTAVAVGACNVEAADALSGVPSWPALMQRIQAGWERLPLKQPLAGWRWLPDPGLWIGPRDKHPFFSPRRR